MNRPNALLRAAWALAGLAILAASGCGDASRSTANPDARPVRIASLTLATDEMLTELVPTERVVSVTALVDDPTISNVAGRYPEKIARLRDIHVELLLSLGPDLILVAPYNTADSLRLLENSGRSTYRNEAVNSVAEIEEGILKLGKRLGEAGKAKGVVEGMEARRRKLAERLQGATTRPRVLFWSAGFTSGKKTTIDDIIRDAGALNVAAEMGLEGSVEIPPERVVAADPDIVLLSLWKDDERQAQVANHPILRQLRAVKENRLVTIEGRYITSISQFVVEGAERLAKALHPDRFAGDGAPR
ncbi:ABC transporter substrate-binding protein [Singulisphaera sp. PoT]|uniref:ABC transporter substrate-binding protein n=1 Tax=Singulisphaera sp. PoT TaxID=3411797 RepID=UPI003BF5C6F4